MTNNKATSSKQRRFTEQERARAVVLVGEVMKEHRLTQEQAFLFVNDALGVFPSYERFRSFKCEHPNITEHADAVSEEIFEVFHGLVAIDRAGHADCPIERERDHHHTRRREDQTDRKRTRHALLDSIRDGVTGTIINERLLTRIIEEWLEHAER